MNDFLVLETPPDDTTTTIESLPGIIISVGIDGKLVFTDELTGEIIDTSIETITAEA